jgi:hypothetical protein
MDTTGVIQVDFLPSETTVTADYYYFLLQKHVQEGIRFSAKRKDSSTRQATYSNYISRGNGWARTCMNTFLIVHI